MAMRHPDRLVLVSDGRGGYRPAPPPAPKRRTKPRRPPAPAPAIARRLVERRAPATRKVSITFSERLIARVDKRVAESGYPDRSSYICFAVVERLQREYAAQGLVPVEVDR